MVTHVEINGLDDGGRIGENIFLVRVGVSLPSELQIILRNLNHFGKLIIRNGDRRGHDEKSLIKYVRDLFDDPTFYVSIFIIRTYIQLQLLKTLYNFLSTDLFRTRKILIEALKEKDEEKFSSAITNLSRFESASIYLESFIKAYGFKILTQRLEKLSSLSSREDVDRFLVAQIDGGYPFVFWWSDLLESSQTTWIKKGSASINGVTSGDEYYPIISAAGTIAYTLSRFPQRNYLFPINELDYPSFEEPDERFYQKHLSAFIRPSFQQRILFIGGISQNIRSCVPYLMYRRERTKTYEPFVIRKSLEEFFKNFGRGSPQNTIIVYGRVTSQKDKENIKLCQDHQYPCFHISEFKDDVEKLISELQEEIDLLPLEKRKSLSAKLGKIKEECLIELE